jgi:FAD dependent oxidoreductase
MQGIGRVLGHFKSIIFLASLAVHVCVASRPYMQRSIMSMSKSSGGQNVVILGAGIHGASVAYYLSTKFGILPTVIERTSIAAAASGKAGGFLAREWGSGSTQQLHQVSFDMHETLGKFCCRRIILLDEVNNSIVSVLIISRLLQFFV